MKKGITPEAAQRLEAFLQKRAQSFDPEEGDLGAHVEDAIWDPARRVDLVFSTAIDDLKFAVEQAVQAALPSVEASFSEAFDAQVAEMSNLVSSAFPEAALPNAQDFEQMKQQFMGEVREVFTEGFQLWISEESMLPSTDGYEVRGLFGNAANRGLTP